MEPNQEALVDFAQRRKSFVEEYGKLVEKHQCDFMSYPTFTPNEKTTWDLRIVNDIVDRKDQPVKSPFVVEG